MFIKDIHVIYDSLGYGGVWKKPAKALGCEESCAGDFLPLATGQSELISVKFRHTTTISMS